MKFRRSRSPFKRPYQRAAIARAYAQKWREANPAELGVFLKTVNDDFAGKPWADWIVKVNARRRTVTLCTPKTEHRATIKPGVVMRDADGYRPITADDVAKFQYRMI